MFEHLLSWAQSLGWLGWLTSLHYAALVLTLVAALLGDGLALRMLLTRGAAPARRFVSVIHGSVLIGLLVLWSTGAALIVTKFSLAALPAKLLFKLAAAALLSVNCVLIHNYLMPLSRRRERPLALTMRWREAFVAVGIGATSAACWAAIAAVAFIKPLQALSLAEMCSWFAVLWVAICVATLGLIAIVRLVDRVRYGKAQRSGDRSRGPVVRKSAQALGAIPVARISAATVNDNEKLSLRERLEAFRAGQQEPPAANVPAIAAAVPVKAPATVASREEKSHKIADVARGCRSALWGAAGVSFFSNMLMLSGPLFMLQIYDRVLTSRSLPTLTALFLLVVGLFAFMALLDFLRARLLVRIGLKVDMMLSGQAFRRAIDVAERTRQNERRQLLKDVQSVRQFLSGSGTAAIFDMPWAPFYFALILMFHWQLGVLALVGACLLVMLSLVNEWASRKPVAVAAKLSADCEHLLEAGRRNSEAIKAMGMARSYQDRWLTQHHEGLAAQAKAADVIGFTGVLSKVMRLVLQSAMLAVGAYLVLGDAISPGVMIAASIILSRALAPIEIAISQWKGFLAARGGWKRLTEAFAEPHPSDSQPLSLPKPQGHLAFQQVYAGPIDTREPVLKGLEFALQPGDALGVLGGSGSGKSTLGRVLVGIWPVLRGTVSIDGAALDQWDREALGQHIGYLPQTVELLDGTVGENISRFDPAAPPEAIIAAARMAYVHDMILSLPDGYNTRVGDGGTVLSGGQRQRIALARALYGQPALVVLDEPNSNLDAEGEQALAKAVGELRRMKSTVVVMAHRKSALEHVNLLLVLKEGRQSSFGRKEDILEAARDRVVQKRRSKLRVA